MAEQSGIEWTDSSLSLWIGCTQVSPACDHCYAMKIQGRLKVEWNGPPRPAAESAWKKIDQWQRGAARFMKEHGRRRRVFINHLSDFFDNQALPEWRDRACLYMEAAPDVIFILVTKRPQNVRKMVPTTWLRGDRWPENVWLLTTAEDQAEYHRRVPHLMTVPGVKTIGISFEPLLEEIILGRSISESAYERARWCQMWLRRPVADHEVGKLAWGIIGGESGHKARPMPSPFRVSSMVSTMKAAKIAVFFKQLSQAEHDNFKEYDAFPRQLQIREYPGQ